MTHLDTPQSVCRFSLARCDITPPVGIYHRMWGAATHDRATGVHRPLTATALAFRPIGDSADEQVVVAVDHCLLWAREMDGLLRHVEGKTGLTSGQLTVAFSHTHAAGLMGRERAELPGGDRIAPYLDELQERLATIVNEARRSAREVTITYGTGRCALAAHRDFWDAASGQYVCGFNPGGPADDTVLVARITDPAGATVATVVHYACHPTTLAWENTLLSPDYPGAMREVVERMTGAPCVFLQGASGDLGPREGFVGDPAVADRNGRQLGYAALAALEALPPPGTRFTYMGPVVSGATLGPWRHVPSKQGDRSGWRMKRWTIDLPLREDLPTADQARTQRAQWQEEETAALAAGEVVRARDCRALAERLTRCLTRLATLPAGRTFALPVALWQIGGAFWLAVEGEHYQWLQRSLRERFPGVAIVVMTLANGSRPAYLVPADAYGKGIYQESIALLAPGCLERVVEEVSQQIAAWVGHP